MAVAARAALGARALMRDQGANLAMFAGAALITAYLGFDSGGFFPDSTAIVTLAVALSLIVRAVLVGRPFEGIGWRAAGALSAMALFAVLTLLSSTWSHAPGRAVVEFNRVLLYLSVFLLFASLPRNDDRLTAMVCGFAAACIVLCGAGLATRALPHLFPLAARENTGRLGWPLTYRNAMGLTAILGLLMCLALSASARPPRTVRSLASAGIPLLAATWVLTFSRGPMAGGLLALVLMCVITRRRSLPAALLAGLVGAVPAGVAAYDATALAQTNPTGPAAVSQGRTVVIVVALSCLAAGVVRFLLFRWELRPTRGIALSPRARRITALSALVIVLVGAVGAAVAFNLPHQLSSQYHQFVNGNRLPANVPLRDRLLTIGNNGRLPLWRVAVHAWKAHPLHGNGAGTYQDIWERRRPSSYAIDVVNAHSLYLEAMAELGIVGLIPLLASLGVILAAVISRVRGADRALAAGLLGALVCWLVHAGVDWDWQMPAISWWVFAAGGLCVARERVAEPRMGKLGQWRRLALAVAVAAVAILPLQLLLAQTNLNSAVTALAKGNCRVAVADALNSVSDLSARAEPYEIIGYCDARDGLRDLSVTEIGNAIDRDPQNWEYRYDMAVVRGIGGLDPRAAAAEAVVLNPLSPLTTGLAAQLNTSNPRVWRQEARRAHLLIRSAGAQALIPTAAFQRGSQAS